MYFLQLLSLLFDTLTCCNGMILSVCIDSPLEIVANNVMESLAVMMLLRYVIAICHLCCAVYTACVSLLLRSLYT